MNGELKAAIERLSNGTHLESDVQMVQSALREGQIKVTAASGERSAVLRDANHNVLFTGDINLLLSDETSISPPTPFEPMHDDSRSTDISWEDRDANLLRYYFGLCGKHDNLFIDYDNWEERKKGEFLIASGLAYSQRREHIFLTRAGILLFCRRERIPRNIFHVHVRFAVKRDGPDEVKELFGSILYLYQELYNLLYPLFQQGLGSPDIRDEAGSESIFYDYPEKAIIEALVNFLIHRDYSLDDQGFITVYPDKVEFVNPGKSEISIEKLLTTNTPLRPLYHNRNPRLIEAMNKAHLNQREGGGILRIRKELKINGSPELILENDDDNNRFILTIFKRNYYSNSVLKSKDPSAQHLTLLRPRQLPSDLADFTGRDREVKDLMNTLVQGEGRVVISAIGGMGGIGKSALAVHVAHQLVDRYPDGQIVVDMQGTSERPLNVIEAMARVIQAFRPEARVADDLEQVAQDYRNTLEGKRALILLDNVANAAQVRQLMPSSPSALIITSRRTIVLEGVRSLSLDSLSENDARLLLREIIGKRRATNEQLDAIAELCGRLPLALRMAGTFLATHRDWTVTEYIETLTDERKRLVHLKQDDLGVEAALVLSTRQLESEHPDLAARWQMLSVFPADFDRAAAAAVWSVTIEEARNNLSALLERSLVLYEENARYRLHDLVRLFTDEQLSEAKRAISQQHHASHYKTVLSQTNALYLLGSESLKQGLAMFDLEWRNIQAGQAWAALHAEKDDTAAVLCSDYSNAGVYILDLRQRPRDRIRWLEAALSAAQRLKLRSTEGAVFGNLGNAYAALGETRRAIEYYEQRLAIAREIGDRRGEGNALGNLGVAYKNLRDMRRAIEYYEQRLAIAREIGDRRGEGNALGNLGVAYAASGETRRAIEYYKQTLIIDREIGDRRGESNVFGNLGNAYKTLGETHRAIEYYEQYLTIAREIGHRQSEGNALFNMSLALDELGDRAQAILNAEAALKIYEQIESPIADETRNLLAQWREPK